MNFVKSFFVVMALLFVGAAGASAQEPAPATDTKSALQEQTEKAAAPEKEKEVVKKITAEDALRIRTLQLKAAEILFQLRKITDEYNAAVTQQAQIQGTLTSTVKDVFSKYEVDTAKFSLNLETFEFVKQPPADKKSETSGPEKKPEN